MRVSLMGGGESVSSETQIVRLRTFDLNSVNVYYIRHIYQLTSLTYIACMHHEIIS